MTEEKGLWFEVWKSLFDKLFLVVALILVGYLVQKPLQDGQNTLTAQTELRSLRADTVVDMITKIDDAIVKSTSFSRLVGSYSKMAADNPDLISKIPFGAGLEADSLGLIKSYTEASGAIEQLSSNSSRILVFLGEKMFVQYRNMVDIIFTEEDREGAEAILNRIPLFMEMAEKKALSEKDKLVLLSSIAKIVTIYSIAPEELATIKAYLKNMRDSLPSYYSGIIE